MINNNWGQTRTFVVSYNLYQNNNSPGWAQSEVRSAGQADRIRFTRSQMVIL